MAKWKLYCHINKLNNKKYIGITKQNVKRRWQSGYGYLKGTDTKFARAIKKYGWNNFEHIILIDNIENINIANELEKIYISKYDTYNNGYNSTLGGDGTYGHECWNKGKHLSEETKLKISNSNKGEKCFWYGKKMTEEQKQKLKDGHNHKPIIQYDLKGNYIMKYNNIQEIKQKYNYDVTSIYKVCNGKRKTAHNYIWKWEVESYEH